MTGQAWGRSGWEEGGEGLACCINTVSAARHRLHASSSPASDPERSGIFRSAEQIVSRCGAEKRRSRLIQDTCY